MTHTLLVHLTDGEPIMVEVDELPKPGDQLIVGLNPRRRDGKEVHYILSEVTKVIFPIWRITFVEVMPSEEEEEIITFVRDE